jgi:hypothetical protein
MANQMSKDSSTKAQDPKASRSASSDSEKRQSSAASDSKSGMNSSSSKKNEDSQSEDDDSEVGSQGVQPRRVQDPNFDKKQDQKIRS